MRWVDNLGDTERTALERALGLYRAEHSEGTTWSYQMPDASPQRLRKIVAHDMVADTNGFDRGTLQLPRRQQTTPDDSRTPVAGHGGRERGNLPLGSVFLWHDTSSIQYQRWNWLV